ncbi:TPA: hypothetical protein QDB08_003627 [Burkholderia vietnamiensis]|uniref:hypothetical protein n=1 Tax=Burkholderia vietnamiensis TaxID=60552 RepID=UPI001593F237|nr:hypothetical protein [Burkholderia vietnamiensis]MBR8087641.1 hypothetical protein [Burkholderia vietnamiensis]MBR8193082.1 hypothetical protein [Burkholderia vietnamiensis]MDN7819691.1 hypothetical protein [Burkholderia vietnamiensis]HDR9010640.1 hypothetical protein [Burkholderia vietnamiensis]HDR9019033.1 hypothetical protein [Burkholderia vietnamiensis]
MDHHLIALYELKRQSFLIGYIQNPEHFDSALAFAYYHRLAPIFHEQVMQEKFESDPYVDAYSVKADFADEVIKYIDERWTDRDLAAVSFYNLEKKFGGHHANRVELIHTLEYARIKGCFDESFWAAVVSDAPVEASNLKSEFSPQDVYFG